MPELDITAEGCGDEAFKSCAEPFCGSKNRSKRVLETRKEQNLPSKPNKTWLPLGTLSRMKHRSAGGRGQGTGPRSAERPAEAEAEEPVTRAVTLDTDGTGSHDPSEGVNLSKKEAFWCWPPYIRVKLLIK